MIEATRNHELFAPDVMPFEIGNALSALVKRRLLSAESAIDAWDAYKLVPVSLHACDVRSSLEIAARYQQFAYDAYFVDVALKLRAPLLTLDRRLAKIAISEGVTVIEKGL